MKQNTNKIPKSVLNQIKVKGYITEHNWRQRDGWFWCYHFKGAECFLITAVKSDINVWAFEVLKHHKRFDISVSK